MRRLGRKGIVGIEAAIVMIAFVIVASAFAFMVVNMGLTSTQRSKEAIQQGLKEASCPLTLDGSLLLKSDPTRPNNVSTIIIPLKTLGVKYVPMWTNETVVSVKIGTKTALANVYAGINHDIDPTGMTFDDIIFRLTWVNETITLTTEEGKVVGYLTYMPVPDTVRVMKTDGTTITPDEIDYDDKKITVSDQDGQAGDTVIVSYKKIVNSVSVVGEQDDFTITTDQSSWIGSFTLDRTPVVPGSVAVTVTVGDNTYTYTDVGDGQLSSIDGAPTATIDYDTGKVELTWSGDPGVSSGSAVSNYRYVVETKAVLVVENDNGDDSLDFFEKGYLIIDLDASQRLEPRDNVLVEIRPEKSAPLTVEFTVPEAIPADAFVTVE